MRRIKNSVKKRFGKYLDYLTEFPLKPMDLQTCFSVDKPFVSSNRIPEVVYQTWDFNEFGKNHLKSLRDFQLLNLDLKFCLILASDRDEYMKKRWSEHKIFDIYKGAVLGPMKVDIFRYCLLFERGGYYFDINKSVSVPLKNLHSEDAAGMVCFEPGSHRILPNQSILHRVAHPDRFVAQWGFAFEKNSPVLKTVIENICSYAHYFANRNFERPKNAILQLTGPGIFTKSFWTALEENPKLQIDQAGINFNGHGDRNILGSHVRYLTVPNYDQTRKSRILELKEKNINHVESG
ncbi:MAG: hypothetical protein NXI02_24410 [Rhodobacteraceae bacterium]|nr:mannosyltransferase OCH1-like enzyme [Labrenzia sp. EL_142]MCR9060503.1 hypothetical protein [Paracoccaceae bacterium]